MIRKLLVAGVAALAILPACGSQSQRDREDAELAEINKIYEEGMADINAKTQNASADREANVEAAGNGTNAAPGSETAAMDSLGAEPETR